MSSLPDEPAPSFTFAAGNQVGGSFARRPFLLEASSIMSNNSPAREADQGENRFFFSLFLLAALVRQIGAFFSSRQPTRHAIQLKSG